MKHRNLRPHNRLLDDEAPPTPRPKGHPTPQRRPRPEGKPPTAPPRLLGETDPGPRPLSPRQKELRQNRLSGQDIIDRAVPPRAKPTPPPPGAERSWREGPGRKRVRDADTTHVRRPLSARPASAAKTRNRRHVSVWPLVLRGVVALFVAECVAVVLWSPRLWVTETVVEGNTTVPTAKLLKDLAVPTRRTLAWLPVGKMRARVLAEPPVESAEIHRRLPGTVQLVVKERTSWASVCSPDGGCYTIDRKLVPFRTSDVPEKGLPRLLLAEAGTPVTLGKRMRTPGLAEVSSCLAWASENSFPLDAVTIAPDGELCLNRSGGMQVKLGTGTDLDKKLNALSVLLARKPDLRESADVAYINLYAYDAPAILPRSAVPSPPPGSVAPSAGAPSLPAVTTAAAPPESGQPPRIDSNP